MYSKIFDAFLSIMNKGIQYYLYMNPGKPEDVNEDALRKWSRIVIFVQEEFMNFSSALTASFGLGLFLAIIMFLVSFFSVLFNYRWRVRDY